MRVVFTEIALQEFNDAARYYEMELPALGTRFRNEVKRPAKRIQKYPQAFPIERGEIRRCLLHRFPYKLLYATHAETLVVLAIAHHRRRPDYWIDQT